MLQVPEVNLQSGPSEGKFQLYWEKVFSAPPHPPLWVTSQPPPPPTFKVTLQSLTISKKESICRCFCFTMTNQIVPNLIQFAAPVAFNMPCWNVNTTVGLNLVVKFPERSKSLKGTIEPCELGEQPTSNSYTVWICAALWGMVWHGVYSMPD